MPSLHANISRREALIAYVLDCEAGSGFANNPGATGPTLEATFRALFILYTYNRLSGVDGDVLVEWVNSTINTDHGFGNIDSAPSDIYSTYYAMWIFKLFNKQINNETDNWVATCQNGTEGFGEKPGQSGTLYATYFGLEALYLNNTNLSEYNMSIWLLERQNNNSISENYGGFSTDGNSSNMWGTWAALESLSRLNVSKGFLKEPLISWINRSQNLVIYEDDFGAFTNKPSATDYSLLNTYPAITSLTILGSSYLSRINLEAALTWLLDLQNDDGGFRVNSIQADSSLAATYYAFCLFHEVGEQSQLLADAPWSYGFTMPLWGWFFIVLGVAILAIVIIKEFYMD
jgi:prenyltransferase beta subunit